MSKTYKITSKVLKEWLESDKAILIDVREADEHKKANIAKAINIPLSDINLDEINANNHKHKKLVFHCLAGKRSAMACDKIMKENPNFDIWDLDGGIDAWHNLIDNIK